MSKGPLRRGAGNPMSNAWSKGGDTRWQRFRAGLLREWKIQGRIECEIKGPKCISKVQQVDHIIPLSKGGEKYNVLNCRPSCQPCNTGRDIGGAIEEPPHKVISTW